MQYFVGTRRSTSRQRRLCYADGVSATAAHARPQDSPCCAAAFHPVSAVGASASSLGYAATARPQRNPTDRRRDESDQDFVRQAMRVARSPARADLAAGVIADLDHRVPCRRPHLFRPVRLPRRRAIGLNRLCTIRASVARIFCVIRALFSQYLHMQAIVFLLCAAKMSRTRKPQTIMVFRARRGW
jgi:hypothetical protein